MVPAVTPLRSLSMAQGCARIDSRLDTAKVGSAGRLEVHRARFLPVIGVRKTFPHGLDPTRTLFGCTVTVSQRGPLTKPRLAKRVDWLEPTGMSNTYH
jgi:hypothetical protein